MHVGAGVGLRDSRVVCLAGVHNILPLVRQLGRLVRQAEDRCVLLSPLSPLLLHDLLILELVGHQIASGEAVAIYSHRRASIWIRL